ncbi:MAG: hypothetical protein HYZ44_17440 [Bacteroidetes bacterium]|nr:hypothetical protein [Bacteroidota bacterium]
MIDQHLLTLIHEWEAEIDRLQHLIDEAVADHEYLSAHYHSEAIKLCNEMIYVLAQLAGKSYTEIYVTTYYVKRLKELIKNTRFVDERDFYLKSLRQKEKQLLKLAAQAQNSKKAESTDTIRTCLEQTAAKKINGFNLILDRDKDVLIKVRPCNGGFQLSIPKKVFLSIYDDDIEGDVYLDEEVQKLCSLGFLSVEDSVDFVLVMKKSKKELINHTMTCLSIVCLEVLNGIISRDQRAGVEIV